MNKKGKPFVIAIAGGSASGKTTLCRILKDEFKELNVKIIHTDDYFWTNLPKVTAPFTQVTYVDYNHPNSVDYEKIINDFNGIIHSDEPTDILIIEGILVLYKEEIRDDLDLKIYVDCQSDERLVRRIKRYEKWGKTFDEITSVYLDAVRYRHNEFVEPSRWHADIVLNGSELSKRAVQIISEWVKGNIHKEH